MPVRIDGRETVPVPTKGQEPDGENKIEKPGGEALLLQEEVRKMETASREITYAGFVPALPAEDQASLSEESRTKSRETDERRNVAQPWTLEQAEELWRLLDQWSPISHMDLEGQLKTLFDLYQSLLKVTSGHLEEPGIQVQLARMEQAVATALRRMMGVCLPALSRWLDHYGERGQVEAVRNSLYRMATGKQITDRELSALWQRPGDGIGTKAPGYGSFARQGVIYQARGSGRVEVREGPQRLEANLRQETGFPRDIPQMTSVLKGGIPVGNFPVGQLVQGEEFTAYITGTGNLFTVPGISGRSEELLGVLAAVTSIKCQEFAANQGGSGSVGQQISFGIDRLIETYFAEAGRAVLARENEWGNRETHAGSGQPDQGRRQILWKDVYKVYYHMMSQYRKLGKPESAIASGIRYALELFRQKKEDGELQKLERYSEHAQFFRGPASRSEGEGSGFLTDWREGKRQLEKDWKEFRQFFGGESESSLFPRWMEQNPWGSTPTDGGVHADEWVSPRHVIWMTLLAAAALLALFYIFK